MLKGLLDNKNKETEPEIKNVPKPKKFSYTVEYFEKRRSQLDLNFNQIKGDLQELSEYFAPRTSRFIVTDAKKAYKKSKKILDSAPILAVKNFAAGMQSGATSAATRWFKTQIKDKELKEIKAVQQWCYEQDELLRKILATSNFYQLMVPVYKQLGVFGFACLSMEPDYDTVVNFNLAPMGSYRYSKDHKGNVDTLCKHYTETASNLVERYGYENCSLSVKQAFDNNQNFEFEVVYFVEKNKEYEKDSHFAKFKKYKSVTYQVGENKFLEESGFDIFPFAIFEAEVNGKDDYPSSCPGIDALPDVRQLMTQVKEYAKAVKKLVSPLYRGPASIAKQKGLTDAPGNIIADTEDGRGLTPVYEVNPRVLELKQHNEELKQTIKDHFYNDLFAVILNTAERGRTATEVNEIKEEKMVLLSPLLDQVHKALRMILDWIFQETIRTGIIQIPPEEIMNKDVQIEFISSLALAQKIKGIASLERFTTFTANIAQSIDPTLVYKVNADKIIDDYAEIANISPSHVVSTEDVDKKREEIKQQQAQQQQMQAIQQGSEMVKNMGGIDAIGGNLAARMGLG